MTHTSLRFTSDSYDQGWPYEKKQQFVQGTDPWCLDIAELKKVITDLDLIKDVSKPRSFYAAMKSESKQLWRYAEALEKKTKMNLQQTFKWGLKSDPVRKGKPIGMHNVTDVKRDKLKVRCVVTGSSETYHEDTFAATPLAVSLKCFLAKAAKEGLHLSLGDISAAFTSTPINEEGICVEVPRGWIPKEGDPGYEDVKGKPREELTLYLEKS